jgi:hypothetical protein
VLYQHEIATLYGISQTQVCAIQTGKRRGLMSR